MPDISKRRLSSDAKTEAIKYVCSLVIIALAVGLYFLLGSFAEKPATKDSNALIPQVSTETVTPYFGALDLVIPGSVKPHREIKVSAEVVGKIVTKHPEFQAGNFVLAGTPLAEIDAQDYQADLNTLAADVEQARKRIIENQRQIEGEKRNLELAKQDFEIQKRDFARTQRLADSLSRSEVDQARRALNASRTNLTSRENAVGLLQASGVRLRSALDLTISQFEKAKLNLGRVSIVAPADGVIVEEMVQENDYVAPGTPIAMFEDVSVAEVVCNLTSAELNWIRKNSKSALGESPPDDPRLQAYQLPKTDVTIFESGDNDVTWQGTLERFDGIGRDEMTKTIPCRIIVPNPIAETPYGPRALVRNMFVKCRVEVETSNSDATQDLLAINEMALQPGNFVWKVVDGKLQRAKIEIVDRTERSIEGQTVGLVIARAIDGSLSPDDEAVVTPLSQPTNGAVVDIAGGKPKTTDEDTSPGSSPASLNQTVDNSNNQKTNAVGADQLSPPTEGSSGRDTTPENNDLPDDTPVAEPTEASL